MRFLVALLAFTIPQVASAAANPWNEYFGCYKVLTFNGRAVKEPQEGDYSGIQRAGTFNFADPVTKEHMYVNQFLFRMEFKDGGRRELHLAEAFLDRGIYSEDDRGSHYRFDGKAAAVFGLPGYAVGNMKRALDVKRLVTGSNYLLQIRDVLSFDKDARLNWDNNFLVQEVSCPAK